MRETHTFIDAQTKNSLPKTLQKSVQVTSMSTPLNEKLLFAIMFLVALFFLKFHVSSSSVKNC